MTHPISKSTTTGSGDVGGILVCTALPSADTGMNQGTDLQREDFMDAFIHIHKYFNTMVTEMLSIFLVPS